MIDHNLQRHCEIAEQAARDAGAALARRADDWLRVDATLARDIKLAGDIASEARILEALSDTGISVLSEEAGAVSAGGNERYRWIVDPIDGTVNYARGFPICCVAIALLDLDDPIVGVVHDFIHNETFTGIVGQGAWCNKQPIHVSDSTAPEDAILVSGLPPAGDFSDATMTEFGRSLSSWKKVRMLGSAALSLAYVAAGRADAYREQGIMLWDVAAGIALVRSAGGETTSTGSFTENALNVSAANPRLLGAMARS